MTTIFDYLSIILFIAAAGLFFYRFRREDPPLTPYVVISVGCAVANWLGNEGVATGALLMLAASGAMIAYLARQPYREDPGDL